MTTLPTVIWHHCVHDDPEPLELVLKCSGVTHVLLAGQGFEDHAGLDRFWTPLVKLVRRSGRTAIVCRWLWPVEPANYAALHTYDLYDWRTYARTLYRLRAEGNLLGCQTAVDLEPYGRDHPVRTLRDAPDGLGPRYDYLRDAVESAVRTIGPADYVLPATLPVPRHSQVTRHLYRAGQPLGAAAIAEHTFYDYPGVTGIADEQFDVFGAYLVASTDGRSEPFDHAYTPARLAERRPEMSRALMLYAGGGADEMAAAQALLAAKT